MPPATEAQAPLFGLRGGNTARWLAIGLLGVGLAASSALGTWRDEHVFNLSSALRLFDMIEKEIATYQARIHESILEIRVLPASMRELTCAHR